MKRKQERGQKKTAMTDLVPREDHMSPLDLGAVPRRLGAVDEQVVLPAAVLLSPGPGLRLPYGLRRPEDGRKSNDE